MATHTHNPKIHQLLHLVAKLADRDCADFQNEEDSIDCAIQALTQLIEQKSSKKLNQQNAHLPYFMDNLPIMINALDENFNFVFWNKECERVTGFSAEEVINNPKALELFYPHEFQRDKILKDFSLLGNNFQDIEWTLTTKMGQEKTIRWSNISGQLPVSGWKVWAVGTDITSQRQAEISLQERESHLQRAESMISMGHFYNNLAGDQLVVSDGIKHIWGYDSHQSMTSESMIAQIHPEDLDKVMPLFRKAAQEKTSIDVEYRIIKPDKSVAFVRNVSEIIYDETQQKYSVFGTSIDITERKQTEEALRQSKARYQALIESQLDLFSRYRPDTTLTYVNDAYCKFYGKSREELIGKSYLTMVAPEFQELAREETNQLVQQPRTISGEYLNFAADGTPHWIHWIIQPIFNENREVIELQAVGRDVTTLKHTEEALRQSEFFLQRSQQVALIGSYYFDFGTREWLSSPMLDQIFGIDDKYLKDVEGWINLVHPDQQEEMRQYLTKHIFEKQDRFDKEFRIIRHNDQQERWVSVLGEPEYDHDNKPIKLIGTIQDITERKQVQETLYESQNRFSVIFNESADLQVISSVEPNGTFRLMALNNRYATMIAQMLNKPAEEVVGKTLHKALVDILGFDEEVYNYTMKYYTRAIETREVIRFEETFSTPAGPFFSESIVAPIFGSSNECRFILYSARDITQRKIAVEQIRQLNEELEQRVVERTKELEQANAEIRHFAYIVSHDLRSPLVNLKGFSAELRSDLKLIEDNLNKVLPLLEPSLRDNMTQALQQDIPESLGFIESSVTNMDQFTKAILKLSRLGRFHLDLIEINVDTLVRKIIKSLNYQITQKNVQIIIGDLPTIIADLVSIEQIFSNIITNALTYLDPQRPGEVIIDAEKDESEICFRVQDNGRGIAPEDEDKIFAPFRRAGKQNEPGEGMGLAYVQTLVRRYGGQIWFNSELGTGTTFLFTIPVNLKAISSET